LLAPLFFPALCRRCAVAPRASLGATLALALGSLIFPYATMFYGHVLAAAFLFGAFHLTSDEMRPPRAALVGLLCGLALLTELTTAPASLLLALHAVRHPRHW